MAVEDRERPRRHHQHGGHGKQDLNDERGERELFRIPPEERDRNENGRQEHAQKRGSSRYNHENAENGSGEPAGLFLPPLLQEFRVHRNHRGAERPLSQKILNHVGDLGRRHPDVHQARRAEEGGQQHAPDKPADTAEKNTRAHCEGGAGTCGGSGGGANGSGHRAGAPVKPAVR